MLRGDRYLEHDGSRLQKVRTSPTHTPGSVDTSGSAQTRNKGWWRTNTTPSHTYTHGTRAAPCSLMGRSHTSELAATGEELVAPASA